MILEAVPKKIHFIWIGSVTPDKYIENVKQFARYNHDYEVLLWVDHPLPPIEKITVKHIGSINLINDALFRRESNIGAKADILRYEIVYNEGGIYNDIDALCLREFGSQFTKPFVSHTFEPWNNITCAVFGFAKKDQFLKFVIDSLEGASTEPSVIHRTGPEFFTRCFVKWSGLEGVDWKTICSYGAVKHISLIHQDLLIFPRKSNEKNRSVGYTFHLMDANWVPQNKVKAAPKISFCTAIKNRLPHLSKTLPQNIVDAAGQDVEFVILDYQSDDGLSEWIRPYVANGLVNYFRTENQPYWRNSHAKNLAHLCAESEVVCNVDADNFITAGFAEHLINFFKENKGIYTAPRAVEGVTGRIAFRKSDFIDIGGYNEEFVWGWGCEDIDLVARAEAMGHPVTYIDLKYLRQISHDDTMRGLNSEVRNIWVSNEKSLNLMKANLKEKKYIANAGKRWGYAQVKKNYKTDMTTGKGWRTITCL